MPNTSTLPSPIQPPADPQFPGSATPPPAPQEQYTREQYAEAERKARAAGDWKWVEYYQRKQSEMSPGTAENRAITPRAKMEEEDPTSIGNLFGAAIEPNVSMLTGALATPLSGWAGLLKGGYNIGARALGGSPSDAQDWVNWVQQNAIYHPHSLGGQNAAEGLALPFTWYNENIAERGGRALEETMVRHGIPGAALAGTAADTLLQALPQVAGGEVLGAVGRNVSPRRGLANIAGMVSPALKEKIARKPPDPDINLLLAHDVVPTMGQRANVSGSTIKRNLMGRGEEWLTRRPFLGAYAIRARERAVEQQAWAQLNEARTPIGLPKLKPGKMSWHDAIKETEAKWKVANDALLTRTKGDPWLPPRPGQGGSPFPHGYAAEISNVLTDAKAGNPPNARHLQPKVYKRLQQITDDIHAFIPKGRRLPNGSWQHDPISGFDLRKIQTLLREEKSAAMRTTDPFYREILPYIDRLQTGFKEMIKRSNPGAAEELKNLDIAYAQLKIVMDAATHGGAAAKSGVFSPAQTLRSVEKRARRQLGEDAGSAMLARGTALGQPLAEAAQRVLGNRVPNSGTPEALIAAGEATADALTGASDPTGGLSKTAITVLLNILGNRALYSEPWQRMLAEAGQRQSGVAGPGTMRMAPATLTAEQRGTKDMDEQMRRELQEFGINPDVDLPRRQ